MDNQQTSKVDFLAFIGFFVVFALANFYAFSKDGGLEFNKVGIGIALGAFFTLSLYSFLYKDNPLFKFTEHFFVGVGMGVSIVIIYFDVLRKEIYSPLIEPLRNPDVYREPAWELIIPMLLGATMFGRFHKKLAWLSRYSFAFVIGFGAGISIPNMTQSLLLKQLESSLIPISFSFDSLTIAPVISGLVLAGLIYLSQKEWKFSLAIFLFFFVAAFADSASFNALLSLVGVISVLIYFYFSTEHKGAVGGVSKIGVWVLMLSFGASFGYTVMGRMALLVGRIQFLIRDWLTINT